MSVGFLFSSLLGQLPLIAVLVVGLVLVSSRAARMGPRSALFARLGLAALALSCVLGLAWGLLLPTLYSRLDYSVTQYGLLFSGFGLITALLSAAGIGLLIAAAVSRSPGPGFESGPPGGGQGFASGPPGSGQGFAPGPPGGGQGFAPGPMGGGPPVGGQPHPGPQPYGGGQPYGTGEQPAGPAPGPG
jgi:hypothetical protein